MKKINLLLALFILIVPALSISLAYESSLFGLGQYLLDFIKNTVLWLIFSLAVIFFLWNMLMYIRDPGKVKESSKNILFGLIALTIMFTVYGIIKLFADTFNFDIGVPQFFVGSR
jgi:amino acid transporter